MGSLFCNRRRIGLVLALLVLLPWLPTTRSVPTIGPARRLEISRGDYLMRIAFAPDGRSLATADIQGRAVLLPLGEERGDEQDVADRGHGKVLAFAPDGRALLTAGNAAGIVRYDLSRRVTKRLPGIDVAYTSDLQVAPDGRILAVASFRSNNIVVWDMGSGRVRATLAGHRSPVRRLAFAPDGRSLASAAVDDRHILIWDLDPQPRLRRHIPTAAVLSLVYSPDGTLLASASGEERVVRIWDARTGRRAGTGTNARPGEPVRLVAGHLAPTRSVAISPDGTLLATASCDGFASLWSVATGRERWRLESQASILTDIAFSPDGRTLAVAATDGNIRLWDLSGLVPDQLGPK